MQLAPIVLFVYNRPWHTEQTLNALAANYLANESLLYIYADGPKDNMPADALESIKQTRDLIKKKTWCRETVIIESDTNKGLANSVIHGVTEVIDKHGKVIVLEDDLVTHPFFLNYMNEYLNTYENDKPVISIHGFMYPVKKAIKSPFFLKGADCWGWATWKRGWDLFEPDAALLLDKLVKENLTKEFNFNNTYNYISLLKEQIAGTIDSWAIRWYASAFLHNKLTLYPPVSLINNIGFDGSGTHKDSLENSYTNNFKFDCFELERIDTIEDRKAKKQIEAFFSGPYLTSLKNKLSIQYRNKFKKSITFFLK